MTVLSAPPVEDEAQSTRELPGRARLIAYLTDTPAIIRYMALRLSTTPHTTQCALYARARARNANRRDDD